MRSALILLFVPAFAFAQGADFMDGVRPFMSFIEDAAVTENMYGEGQFQYADFEGGSSMSFGVQGAYRVMPLMEAGGRFGFASISPEEGDGESGLLDADIYGRYTVSEGPKMRLVAGGMINLPIGSDKIGEGTFDFQGFGAMRYAMTKGVMLAHFGLRINGDSEVETAYGTFDVEREMQFLLGGGILYPLNEMATLTGEFDFESAEFDGGDSSIQLAPGIDYQLGSGLKVRGALALGLSDGAPDMVLMAGVAKNL
ncbi:MAG: hypothetical protein MUE60_16675 [Candidatus Eisenbacteria bacterium]|nr:hypothetical protein [Candidatus Eisenbacteria bacterium]